MNPPIEDGSWHMGLDSVSDPASLSPGHYQFAINATNKGGVISTRPGWRSIQTNGSFPVGVPVGAKAQGMKIFTPRNGVPHLVVALGGVIIYNKFPFPSLGWKSLEGVGFDPDRRVEFEIAVLGVTQDVEGNITSIDPYPILMMFDGVTRTSFWDGTTARRLDPTPTEELYETPVCTYAKWIGNRLWTLQGKRVRVSNLLNPLKFDEEDILAEGGYFNLPDEGTGMGVTPDFKSILAFTDFTTTAFQAGILNRTQWQLTPEFQKVIFSHIGCAAHRSIINQYGMTWWYSHGGLMNLDNALQTYRSSQIRYQDQDMRRSRANFSDDISGICSIAYENYLLLAVPSGDLHNYHVWVLDGNPVETVDTPARWASVWTGIRPVQFASGVINGKWRCFALSDDLPPEENVNPWVNGLNVNVWEMFLQDRRDIGHDDGGDVAAKDIPVSFETKLFTAPAYSKIKYAELEFKEMAGTIQLDVYYAANRGVYKNILSKQVVATIGSVEATIQLQDFPNDQFEEYLPQRRYVKTVNESILGSDENPIVETPFTRNKDRAYSFLIRWTGQASLSKIRIYTEPEPEQMDGTDEVEEATDRYVQSSGGGEILLTGPTELPIVFQESGFLSVNSHRWSEGIYQSVT